MSLISFSKIETTAVISLNNGITNALNIELLKELSAALVSIQNENQITAVVISSANEKIFSLGFDLPNLLKLERHAFKLFFEAFNLLCLQIYTFPKPIVSAINGHAIAGGCIITLCCDFRLIASGRRLMGLNEVRLGIPVPLAAEIILRQLVGNHVAEKVIFTGQLYTPDELHIYGLVDRVVKPEKLKQCALEQATMLGKNFNSAFQIMKLNTRQKVADDIKRGIEDHSEKFIDLWFSQTARELLTTAAEKF